MKVPSFSLLLCLAGCATGNALAPDRDATSRSPSFDQVRGSQPTPDAAPSASDLTPDAPGQQRQAGGPRWRKGQALQQGYIGVSTYDEVSREGGSIPDLDGDQGDLDEMFLLGGGGQWKLSGDKLDLGLEAFLALQGRGDADALVVGGGGAAVAVDVDLMILDLYGGPMVSTFLGDSLRLYAGAGPMIGWAFYDQGSIDGSGFGYGLYVRTGLDIVLGRFMVGVATRWMDAHYDLDGGLGDVDIDGFQWMITFTTGL